MDQTSRPAPGASGSSDQPLGLLVGAMAGTLVLLGVVLAVIGAELLTPPAWMLLVVAAATAGAWTVAGLAPVRRPGAGGDGGLHPLVLVRAAVLEAPAFVGLALSFLSDPMNLTIYVLPALLAVAGLWLFARPGAVRARLA
jgi:hypothetical protein